MGVRQVKKRDIIAAVAKETGLFKSDVAMFYNEIEKAINEFLLTADKESDVEVRVFDGVYLSSKYAPAGEAFRPDLQKHVPVPEGIAVKSRLTHGYKVGMKNKYRVQKNIILTEDTCDD